MFLALHMSGRGSVHDFGCFIQIEQPSEKRMSFDPQARLCLSLRGDFPTQFRQGDILELTDSLSRNPKILTYVFEGLRFATI
jgi:hypothetical protein